MVYTVPKNDLDSWLQAQPENTVDTPYEIEVTGLTVNDFSSQNNIIKTALINNPLKYVDLRNTAIPSGVTSLEKAFYDFNGCKTLVYSPVLPNSLVNLVSAFDGCSSLKEAPTIPDSVRSMTWCFRGCSNLVYPPNIPYNEKGVFISAMFQNCTSLVEAPVLPECIKLLDYTFRGCTSLIRPPIIPEGAESMEYTFSGCTSLVTTPNIPNSVTNMRYTFEGCTSLTTVPTISSNVLYMDKAFMNCTSLVDVATIPNCSLQQTFKNCTSLVNAPIILGSNQLSEAFMGCTSLVNPPLLPQDRVIQISSCFEGCTSLAYKPIPAEGTTTSEINSCYTGVTQTRWGGDTSRLNTWIPQQSSEFEVWEIDGATPTGRAVYGVDLANVDTLLNSLDENTVDTPYELKVINIDQSHLYLLANKLYQARDRYVDLRYTTYPYFESIKDQYGFLLNGSENLIYPPALPEGITSLVSAFNGCTNLKETPTIPSTVTQLSETFMGCRSLTTIGTIPNSVTGVTRTFKDCTSLVTAPTIPNSVTVMSETFENCSSLENITLPNNVGSIYCCFKGCTSLTNAPSLPNTVGIMTNAFEGCSAITEIALIPATVAYAKEAFKNCTSLRKINDLQIPLNTLKNNANFQNMFQGCVSLTQIGYKVNESDWHVWRLKFGASTVEGKVYDRNGNYVAIPQTSITKSSLKLPIKTDELWFPDMTDPDFDTDAKIDAIIEKVIQFRYTYHINAVIEPDKKTFVLQADDPDNFITNLPIIPQQAVDRVESGNMNPVTSNAVANYKPVAGSVELNANNIIKFKETSLNGYKIQDVQTNALYVEGREGDSGDSGGVVITNDGVTAFGAGDTDGVFRVVNEDNPTGGAVFKVMKDGTVYGGTYNGKASQAARILLEGSTWDGHFWWSGNSGQPTWLWGSNDGVNMYLWNPSNFSVAYASRAGSSGGGTLYDAYGMSQPLGEYSYMINNGLLIFVAWITIPSILPFNLPCAITDRYWSGSIQTASTAAPRTQGLTTGQTQCGIIIGGVA